MEKKLNKLIFCNFPDFGLKSCLLLYRYVGHFGNISWFQVVAINVYGHFVMAYLSKIRIFWSKRIRIEYALKSALFLLKLSYNTDNATNMNMKKKTKF